MGIFAGKNGARTSIGAYPRTTVARTMGDFQQTFPTGILSTFLIAAFRDARIQVFLHDTRIETRDDIDGRRVGIALCALIVNRTGGVELMKPSRHGSLVGAIATLVAQAPEDDRRMVLVALSHADGTIEEGIAPVGGGSQGATKSVCLAIGLVHHIHAYGVAELIPARTIGIVGQTDGIDMGSFHELEVLEHALFRHYTSGVGVVLMTIDTTNLDGFTIDEQLTILDMDVAETHLLSGVLDGLAIGVFEFQFQGVEVGVLSTPKMRIADLDFHAVELTMATLGVPLVHASCFVLEVEDFRGCNRIATYAG